MSAGQSRRFAKYLMVGMGLGMMTLTGAAFWKSHIQDPTGVRIESPTRRELATADSPTIRNAADSALKGDAPEVQNEQKWIDKYLPETQSTADWVMRDPSDESYTHFHNDYYFTVTILQPDIWKFSTHVENASTETKADGNVTEYNSSPTRSFDCRVDIRKLDWTKAKVGGGEPTGPFEIPSFDGSHRLRGFRKSTVWFLQTPLSDSIQCDNPTKWESELGTTTVELMFPTGDQAEEAKSALIAYTRGKFRQGPAD